MNLYIKKIYAKNFIGIYKGLGLTELELTFNDSGIIAFSGQNGSGKTSVLYLLQPFCEDKNKLIVTETEDDSGKPRIRYKEATKKITYIDADTDDVFDIVQLYSKTGTKKAYISKNGEELNPNGNVTSYNAKIAELFNTTDSVLTNSVITTVKSNTFLEASNADRKKLIAFLLPDISAYKVEQEAVRAKIRDYKNTLSYINTEIEKLGSEEDIAINIKNLEENIPIAKKEIEDARSQIESIQAQRNIILGRVKAITEDTTPQEYIDKATKRIEQFEHKFGNLEVFLSEEQIAKIADLKQSQTSLEQDLTDKLKPELIRLNKELTKINSSIIDFMEASEVVNRYKREIASTNNDIEGLLEDLHRVKEEQPENVNTLASSSLTALNPVITILNEVFNKASALDNGENFYSKESIPEMEQQLNKAISESSSLRGTVETYTRMLTSSKEFPDDCISQKCIAKFNDMIAKSTEMINDRNKEIQRLKDRISVLRPYKEIIQTYFSAGNKLQLAYTHYRSIDEEFVKSLDEYITLENIMKINDTLSSRKEELENDIKLAQVYTNLVAVANNIESSISTKRSNLQRLELLLENSLKENSDKLLLEKEELLKKKKGISSDIENLELEISKVEKSITEIRSEISASEQAREIVALKNNVEFVENSMKAYNDLNPNTEILTQKEEILEELTKSVYNYKSNLASYNKYMSDISRIDDELKDLSVLDQALDFKKGLPALKSNKILSLIEAKCNLLLEKYFSNRFSIMLNNSDKELEILVSKDNSNEYFPYSVLSGGESSLIKMVLSFVLSTYTQNKTPSILRLDEAETFLDSDSRNSFEILLDRLLNEENVRQIFIISHNIDFMSQTLVFKPDENRVSSITKRR